MFRRIFITISVRIGGGGRGGYLAVAARTPGNIRRSPEQLMSLGKLPEGVEIVTDLDAAS